MHCPDYFWQIYLYLMYNVLSMLLQQAIPPVPKLRILQPLVLSDEQQEFVDSLYDLISKTKLEAFTLEL